MKDVNNSYGIIIQARMNSSRLPGKVLKDIIGKPMLQRQIERLIVGSNIPVVVATSNQISDNPIYSLCSEIGIKCFRGSLNNVVLRFLECAKTMKFKYIIRVGGDDPLIDPDCCNELLRLHKKAGGDFLYASHEDGWPYGCAAELISKNSLEKIIDNTSDKIYLEHTIPYLLDNPHFFKTIRVKGPLNLNGKDLRLSVDYPEDLELIREVFKSIHIEGESFSMKQIANLMIEKPELSLINKGLHEGFGR